ncbi:MAG: tripartite tricarboxylate transporter substrate binding protein [Ramlibacter sp.]|jgi:tripartite-type tricarboxylate transporter receptor subunit TctC|uniref:Bug family tripartite tricarboxylate transporter substrate binding protein n=1 Tax=Ramlibacter sp. TaxID=1917967 RepID=UPI00261FD857|nr:tripartite tricarboxylate transporter substrate binding protein [Ramlibacter sp.]MDH4377898.1 tripartite tricarboxylate transporter substrate binding protein [Ramlibacter sp.]
MKKRSLFALALAGMCAAVALPVQAQSNWPTKPIKLVVPFPAGGPVDLLARTIAPRLGEVLGQSVTVDNRAGASGIIGMDSVHRADPDGYTFGMGVPGGITVLPHLQKVPYSVDEINYVTMVARTPQVCSVGPNVPVKTLAELIALAKKDPGKLNFGSAGNATSPHLGTELLAREAGIKMTHIPFNGAAPAITALLAGNIDVLCADLPPVMAQVSRGVKILSVNSQRRSDAIPTVPTAAELGLPNVVADSNYGLIASKGLPPAIMNKMRDAMHETLRTPAVASALASQGLTAAPTSSDDYRRLMQAESVRWGALVREAKISIQ